MWTAIVDSKALQQAGRWTVSYFQEAGDVAESEYPIAALSQVLREQRGSADPQGLGSKHINYVGLENVRSVTGELTDFNPRPALEIKSRSKTFAAGDILFGRLRPELNKVLVVSDELGGGLCSGEFYVLRPTTGEATSHFWRHVLASKFVTEQIGRFRAGASLPRVAIADLLSIQVPVPPAETQVRLSAELRDLDAELVLLRERLDAHPNNVQAALVAAVTHSGVSISGGLRQISKQ